MSFYFMKTSVLEGGNKSIDGLRAVAILMVLFFHAGAPLFGFGWLGVDLFFVLSGFLITTLLLREYKGTGHINVRMFMLRRFFRIMPAYWIYALLITVLILFGVGEPTPGSIWTTDWLLASIWGYFNNYLPRGGIWDGDHLVGHLWSLSVEEQFYIIWPLAFLLACRINRLTVLVLVVFLLELFFYIQIDRASQGFLLYTRGIGLTIGCMAAVFLSDGVKINKYVRGVGDVFFLLFFLVSALLCVVGLSLKDSPYIIVVLDMLFSLLIAWVWVNPAGVGVRWLGWRPFVVIGKISYGIYLYHMLAWYLVWYVLLAGIDDWPSFPKFGLRLVVYLLLSFGIAWLSYIYIEKPFLMLKEKYRSV